MKAFLIIFCVSDYYLFKIRMNCLRNTFDKVTVRRSHVCEGTLEYFLQLGRLNQMDKIKSHLKVTFENEPGVDQGGLVSSLVLYSYSCFMYMY